MAAQIIAETGGNPLAIVEGARALTREQLGGRAPLPEPLPVGHQLDVLFVRRVRDLPPDTQTLLLLASADQPGPGDRLWRAATALGIPEFAAVPAEAAGLVAFWPQVRFFHPLVRSAVYYAATAVQRRQAHPGPRGGLRSGARCSSPGMASGSSRRQARRRGRGRAGGGSRPGREPWWLCRRGLVPGTRGAADARSGTAG